MRKKELEDTRTFVIMTTENVVLEITFNTPSGDEVAITYATREVAETAISLISEEDKKKIGPLRVVEQMRA